MSDLKRFDPVKRYDRCTGEIEAQMSEYIHGDYVLFSDVQKLLATKHSDIFAPEELLGQREDPAVEAVKKILSKKMLMHFSADEVSATVAQVVAAVKEAK